MLSVTVLFAWDFFFGLFSLLTLSVKGKKNTMAVFRSCSTSMDDSCSSLFPSVTFLYLIFPLNRYPSLRQKIKFSVKNRQQRVNIVQEKKSIYFKSLNFGQCFFANSSPLACEIHSVVQRAQIQCSQCTTCSICCNYVLSAWIHTFVEILITSCERGLLQRLAHETE